MDPFVFRCADADARRSAVAAKPGLNGIDWLEVADLTPSQLPAEQQSQYAAIPPGPRRDQLLWQRKLVVHFVNPLTDDHQAALSPTGILLSGGARIPAPTVDILSIGTDSATLRASTSGDTSRYRLDLVRSAADQRPPPMFDPLLCGVPFSFKVGCPTELDCLDHHVCPTPASAEPRLDYLARDYATFRRLILDRLALLSPNWTDRSPADAGIALVELFAYVGDRLTYAQDAAATEAYLGTARLRRSVRRHARLVDYAMHDGCNARAWVQVAVSADVTVAPSRLRFLTRLPDLPFRIAPASREEAAAYSGGAQWFEPLVADLDRSVAPPALSLFAAHNEIPLYDWDLPDFSVPEGATEATLVGHLPTLTPGDVLVLTQTLSPQTGLAADTDPARRHAVRLTRVQAFDGPDPLTDPLTDTEITHIAWEPADALPFGLCVTTAGADSTPAVVNAAAALGNIVIADHGRTVAESLGSPGVRRFRPALQEHPLTQSGTVLVRHPGHPRVRLRFDPTAPARAAVDTEPGSTRPELWLTSTLDADSTEWTAVADLLDSGAEDPHVVAETEADGSCQLRFGAHGHGRPPRTAEVFSATYRYGNGVAGNIGADALGHVITAEGRITGVRNPLPASGGTEPEAIAQVRRRAPEAFRTQQRAVTPGDYERVATRSERVQRAAATMRWTGSWHTVFLTVDPIGDTVVDAGFEQDILDHVEPFRLAGHDVEIDAPHYVSLEVALEVCVTAEHFRSDVRRRLQVTLSATDNDDGTRGLFHPDAFTFGQPVYLSPILAAARAVAGVDSVRATVFQRLGSPSPIPLAQGRLPLGRLEIARLDNDPNFPEHGTLRIVLHGGK